MKILIILIILILLFVVATVITGVYAVKLGSKNLGWLCFGFFCLSAFALEESLSKIKKF